MSHFICFILILFVGDNIKIKSKPSNPGSILVKQQLLIGTDAEFYDRIISTRAINGAYVVMDRGNSLVKVFNKDGHLETSFGRAGQGPGEISRPRYLAATKDRIIVVQTQKTIVFDYSGKVVQEIKNDFFGFNGPRPILFDDHFFLVQRFSTFNKNFYKSYNYNGNLLESKKNNGFSLNTTIEQLDFSEFQRNNIKSPRSIQPFNDGFIWFLPGEYKIEILTSRLEVERSYFRDFERVNEDYSDWDDPEDEKMSKEQRAAQAQMRKNHIKLTRGFESDIVKILGEWNNFLLVQTSSENLNKLQIDVISKHFKLFDIISIECDLILEVELVNNQLLVSSKNNDIGPYLTVYNLELAK